MSKRSAVLAGLTTGLLLLLSPADGQGQGQNPFSALPQTVDAPPDNPLTADKVALGKLLFWDPILSGHRDVACASCHHPRAGYAEDRDLSIGVNGIGFGRNRRFQSPNSIPFVKRNSPTMLNVAFNGVDQTGRYTPAAAPMFWDMRVRSLETQALEPIKSFEEMRGDAYPEDKAIETVVERLNAIPEYRALFGKAFGDEKRQRRQSRQGARHVRAIACRQQLAVRSLYARRPQRDDARIRSRACGGSSASAARSATTDRCSPTTRCTCSAFRTMTCFRNQIAAWRTCRPRSGRAHLSVRPTRSARRRLRNLKFTAPYMHSGVFRTLFDVIEFYDDVPENPNVGRREVDPLARQLDDPDDEAGAIIAFLEALNDDTFDKTIPPRVPSGLNPGGRIQ